MFRAHLLGYLLKWAKLHLSRISAAAMFYVAHLTYLWLKDLNWRVCIFISAYEPWTHSKNKACTSFDVTAVQKKCQAVVGCPQAPWLEDTHATGYFFHFRRFVHSRCGCWWWWTPQPESLCFKSLAGCSGSSSSVLQQWPSLKPAKDICHRSSSDSATSQQPCKPVCSADSQCCFEKRLLFLTLGEGWWKN